MKKVILYGLLLVVVVAACIFFYHGRGADATTSATNFPKNEASAPSMPEHEPEPERVGILYASLDDLLFDIDQNQLGINQDNNNPVVAFFEDTNEILLLQDIEIDDTYIISGLTFNLNKNTIKVTSNGYIELQGAKLINGNIRVLGFYTEEHIINVYDESKIQDCSFYVNSEANVLYIVYITSEAHLIIKDCVFDIEKCDIDKLRIIGVEGHITISNCIFCKEEGHKGWDSIYMP